MKTVMIFASNCFSGSDLVDLLLEERDYRVIGVGRSPERPEAMHAYRRREDLSRFTYHQLDLNRDADAICDLIDEAKPSYVVNFAAQGEVGTSWQYPERWFQTNAVAVARLTNHLRKCETLERYVHISSPEVYGSCEGHLTEDAPVNPSTPYAASKAAGDMMVSTLVKGFDFPAVFIRATNVYGAGQQLYKILPRSVIYLKTGRTIELHGGGHAVKSYIHIRDVSRGELAAMEQGETGSIYHLSPDGSGIAIRDLVEMVCDRMGRSFEESTSIVSERLGQDKAYLIDSSRARSGFGWRPEISMEQGVSEVIDWLERYWEDLAEEPRDYIHVA